jgi:hypothetical protein
VSKYHSNPTNIHTAVVMSKGGGVSPSLEVEGGGVEVDGGCMHQGSGIEVDGLRKRMVVVCSEGGSVEVDGLSKRIAVACSEVEVEVAAFSRAGDEEAACSGARIKDDRWRWWHDGF